MHILILSDAETLGGAAVATTRLVKALVEEGCEVTRVVGRRDEKHHSAQRRLRVISLSPAWERIMLKAYERLFHRSTLLTRTKWASERLCRLLDRLRPDIINIHNLHGRGWLPDLVETCIAYAPVVWTLHDMWSFTGRCTYSYNCEKFIEGCDETCPTPTEYPALPSHLVPIMWNRRRRLLNDHANIVAVSPSRWLATIARRGLWKARRVEVIPNGIPLDIYSPIERLKARSALGLECKGPVLLIMAHDLNESRKGGKILLEGLKKVRSRPITLIIAGKGGLPVEDSSIVVYHLGFLSQTRQKVLAYNAADLLLHPAIVDNFPNVLTEALACGTPAIGFRRGGIPEIIRPGKSGWVVDVLSSESFGEAIDYAIREISTGNDLRHTCRRQAVVEYDVRFQAKRYIDLFKTLARS